MKYQMLFSVFHDNYLFSAKIKINTEAVLTSTQIYVLSRNMRIFYLKIFIFGDKIFSIFE